MPYNIAAHKRSYANYLGKVAEMGGAPAKPDNTVAPVLSGDAEVGATLTVTNGTWTGRPEPIFVRRWLADDEVIPGAGGLTYKLTPAERGKKISVQIIAQGHGSVTVTTDPTAKVDMVPVNIVLPVITGKAGKGEELSVSDGEWQAFPEPVFTYAWQADGVPISGATSNTFTLTTDEVGAEITVEVTATNDAGDDTVETEPTAEVTLPPANTVAPAITGTAKSSEELTVSDGTWDGYPVPTFTYAWFADDDPIEGAEDATYTLTEDEIGTVITAAVTATNEAGTATAVSAATSEVAPGD